MALKLNERYPGRFDNPTAAYPQGSFKNRSAPGVLDGAYLEKDWANDKEGFFQALMVSAGLTANGSVDTATASQYFSALQSVIMAGSAPDYLNTARIDVASASNVNLATAAPGTRNINVTGSTTINGFTVASGQLYFVRFNFVLTLVNSAGLVTQTGANIVTAPGDTCIIRATSANNVEVLCYSSPLSASIGIGQEHQNVTVSRALSTTYTNTAGRPIGVIYTGVGGAGSSLAQFYTRGSLVRRLTIGPTEVASFFEIVTPGSSYSIVQASGSMESWWEIRS